MKIYLGDFGDADRIVAAAVRWWKGKRPRDWNEEKHIKNPGINCFSDRETRLARAIAKLVQRKAEQKRDLKANQKALKKLTSSGKSKK